MKSSTYYFHIKTKILADFQICISVPLSFYFWELPLKPSKFFQLILARKSIVYSHRRCSMKKGVLRNFSKFIEKHLCQSLFFKKRDSGTGVFLWICEIFKTTFLQSTSGRLLLNSLILILKYPFSVTHRNTRAGITLFWNVKSQLQV